MGCTFIQVQLPFPPYLCAYFLLLNIIFSGACLPIGVCLKRDGNKSVSHTCTPDNIVSAYFLPHQIVVMQICSFV
jgi:hypothetical protein